MRESERTRREEVERRDSPSYVDFRMSISPVESRGDQNRQKSSTPCAVHEPESRGRRNGEHVTHIWRRAF